MHIFFFIFLIIFIPSHSEGMGTMQRLANKLINVLSQNNDKVLVSAAAIVCMIDFGEVSESEEEELFNWLPHINWLSQKEEENKHKVVEPLIKKLEEKQDFLREDMDNSVDDLNMFIHFFSMGLLYELTG